MRELLVRSWSCSVAVLGRAFA